MTGEGERVVIGAEDITIIRDEDGDSGTEDRGIEGDRLKALGDFRVEVRVKGGEPVGRTVSIQRPMAALLDSVSSNESGNSEVGR